LEFSDGDLSLLRNCKTQQEVEDVFGKHNFDYQKKLDLLIKAMYEPVLFFSDETEDAERQYHLAMQMFLGRKWDLRKWNLGEIIKQLPQEVVEHHAAI
jgi:hypothetical protein